MTILLSDFIITDYIDTDLGTYALYETLPPNDRKLMCKVCRSTSTYYICGYTYDEVRAKLIKWGF